MPLRHEFEKKVQEIEFQENRIMGIYEYGEEFEKILKKKVA